MRDHPLNPMRDSLLTRVLAAQTSREVSLVPLPVIDEGVAAVSKRLVEIAAGGARHAIADTVRDGDLETLAQAVAAEPFAAGGAAFGAAYAAAARGGADGPDDGSARAQVPAGPAAILVGSLSQATRGQVEAFDGPVLRLTVGEMVDGDAALERLTGFVGDSLADGPVLIATDLADGGSRNGAEGMAHEEVARAIERTNGRMGAELEKLGVRRLIVAGGETSGAVADSLGLDAARIGPDISVGVPWMVALDRPLAVAFKSGNFGAPTFFAEALEVADA